MVDAGDAGPTQLRHDAEMFRVAEELMMLSTCGAPSRSPPRSKQRQTTGSPSNISGFFEPISDSGMVKATKAYARRRQHKMASTLLDRPRGKSKMKRQHPRGAALDEERVKQEPTEVTSTRPRSPDIINSRCDLSHSELLKEHRSRFRRVRRRWNSKQRTKNREYLARFRVQVQGVPLVQHLEALTHCR